MVKKNISIAFLLVICCGISVQCFGADLGAIEVINKLRALEKDSMISINESEKSLHVCQHVANPQAEKIIYQFAQEVCSEEKHAEKMRCAVKFVKKAIPDFIEVYIGNHDGRLSIEEKITFSKMASQRKGLIFFACMMEEYR